MPLSLGVRQIVALVLVGGQAETALVLADVVPHKIGILGEVDGLQCQTAQALFPRNLGLLI